jgi:hypothetical protein
MIACLMSEEEEIIARIPQRYANGYAFFSDGSRVSDQFSKKTDLDLFIKGNSAMPSAVLCDVKVDSSRLPFIRNFVDYYRTDNSFDKSIEPNLIRITL